MKESKSKSVYLYHLRCLFRQFFHFPHERLLLLMWPVNRPKSRRNWLYLPWSFCVLKKGKKGLTAKGIRKLHWKYPDRTDSWYSKFEICIVMENIIIITKGYVCVVCHKTTKTNWLCLPSKLELRSFGCKRTDLGETYSKLLVVAGRACSFMHDDWVAVPSPKPQTYIQNTDVIRI